MRAILITLAILCSVWSSCLLERNIGESQGEARGREQAAAYFQSRIAAAEAKAAAPHDSEVRLFCFDDKSKLWDRCRQDKSGHLLSLAGRAKDVSALCERTPALLVPLEPPAEDIYEIPSHTDSALRASR
jgi:hypothetical protein